MNPFLKRYRLFLGATVVASLLLVPILGNADVTMTRLEEHGPGVWIKISGTISQADAVKFKEIRNLLRPQFDVVEVELDTQGGDVLAALEIGELVRNDWLWTVASDAPNYECASVCVFILAAGAVRIAGTESKIGIHRPQFDEKLFAGLDQSHAKTKYDELSQLVQAFLSKMGMSDQLFIEMMKVPSNEIRMLSYDELEAFSLVGQAPGYEEWTTARNAAKYADEKMIKFDAWLAREAEFMNGCRASGQSFEACAAAERNRGDPNPLFEK
jgi:hypothetical protein